MKTSKSPENTEVTPSKKKLKQARLPFKLISDVSPKPLTQPTRKRKLSTPDPETVTKIGRICKENDIEELVVISDDESKNVQGQTKTEKIMNPFVKLVDAAWKKKLQKSKKKKNDKSKPPTKGITNTDNVAPDSDCEVMDVDELEVTNDSKINGQCVSTESSPNTPEKISEDFKLTNGTNITATSQEITHNNKNMEENNDVKKSNEDNVNTETIEKGTDPNESVDSSVKEITSHNKVSDSTEQSNNVSDKSKESIAEDNEKSSQIILTPKRSTRNETNKEDIHTPNNKLNDSISSNPSTPKHSRSSSVPNSQENDSMNESTTNLTPKQLQKKLESAKKREEREKEKQEREKKKQQEKEERAKIKQEKEEQKKREREEKEEAKRKEKEEKEEQKRKEKEEKERQKELERKLKEEKEDLKRKEREEKEEQRRKEKEAKEEEKRKRQEALELEKQEQELKKKKAAEAFVNFFVPKQKLEKDRATIGPVSKNSMLSSFSIKADMRLAPTVRVSLDEEKRQELDSLMEQQNVEKRLYLDNLKAGTCKPLSSGKTWPLDDKDDDVMIIEDELPPIDGAGEILTCESAVREKLRPKLLSFHENRRPPYWGTWRKKSSCVKPRRPFGQDEKHLDYEVDSDEEWEEEQEGESIDGSAAGSDDEQDGDEYEVDNEVFVPHGYLSDEEATMDEDDVLSLSPETQKARLKHLEDEFESEMKKPTEKLKPRLYGLLWETKEGGKPDNCVDALWSYFGKLAMIMNDPTPLLQPSNEPEETEKKKVKKKKVATDGEKETKVEKKKKSKGDNKEIKPKTDIKNTPEIKKNQRGINTFLKKIKSP